jgi:hypothetical protein
MRCFHAAFACRDSQILLPLCVLCRQFTGRSALIAPFSTHIGSTWADRDPYTHTRHRTRVHFASSPIAFSNLLYSVFPYRASLLVYSGATLTFHTTWILCFAYQQARQTYLAKMLNADIAGHNELRLYSLLALPQVKTPFGYILYPIWDAALVFARLSNGHMTSQTRLCS